MVFLQYESADYALQFEIVTIYGRVIHVSLQFNIVKTFCHNICKHVVFLQYESAHYALQFEIVTIYGRVIYIQIIL